MPDFIDSADSADRCGSLEALTGVPGTTFFFRNFLQIAPRQVYAYRITENMLLCPRALDIFPGFPDSYDQFNLMMQFFCAWRVRYGRTALCYYISRLHKVKRRLAIRVRPDFPGMCSIVTADTIYSVDRKATIAASYIDKRVC